MCGPPAIILSDQGTEFNNRLVNSLIKATGVDHRVTSAYHPQTNGKVERFNALIPDTLRKFTAEDHMAWPIWIPFVLIAFRSKVHNTTKYTPFELMFGRKMNKFQD